MEIWPLIRVLENFCTCESDLTCQDVAKKIINGFHDLSGFGEFCMKQKAGKRKIVLEGHAIGT